jgi:hypothetical protein
MMRWLGRVVMAAKTRRKSAFVPRILVRTAIVGVVPACAIGCGGGGTTTSSSDAGSQSLLGVAQIGYDAAGGGGSSSSGGGGTSPTDGATDAAPDAIVPLGVAAVAYQGYEAGAPDGGVHGGDAGATDARPDAPFPVWVLAVTAYEVGAPKKS